MAVFPMVKGVPSVDGGGKLIHPVADGSGYPKFEWDYDAECLVVFGKPNTFAANLYYLNASSPKRWWGNASYVWQISNSPNVTNVSKRSLTINEFGTSWSGENLCAIPLTEIPDGYFT